MSRRHFYRKFDKDQFAEALASYPQSIEASADELYAQYRLGLYITVSNGCTNRHRWRAAFAKAVSYAACGNVSACKSEVARLLAGTSFPLHPRVALAEALAQYSPELALQVAYTCKIPVTLRSALLSRLGRADEAITLLRKAFLAGEAEKRAEFYLHQSNIVRDTPLVQLDRLNQFLNAFGLARVALSNATRSLGPMNLRAADRLPSIADGPLVTIIMTAYQAQERVATSIQSLLNQTWRNIEVLVLDDASEDNTAKIVSDIAAVDVRVRYLRMPVNVGTYVAKNIGLMHAKGEFVTCQDSDDWAHPQKIERQIAPLIADPKIVFTTSHWVRMRDNGVFYARQIHPLLRINPASPMFRKKPVLERAGAWDPVRTGADSEFAARLSLVFGREARKRIAEPLTFGSHRSNSLMTAADTGYDAAGVSPVRLDYWESWGHAHIAALREKRLPFVSPDMLTERAFLAPPSLLVPKENIQLCLSACHVGDDA